MLLVDHLAQLAIVPVVHGVIFVVVVAHIHVQRPLLHLPLNAQVVREFAFVALGALAGLEECTHHRLGIGALFHLLCLYRSAQRGKCQLFAALERRLDSIIGDRRPLRVCPRCFDSPEQSLQLFLLLQLLLLLLFLGGVGFQRMLAARLHLFLDLLDEFLVLGTLLVLQTESFVLQRERPISFLHAK